MRPSSAVVRPYKPFNVSVLAIALLMAGAAFLALLSIAAPNATASAISRASATVSGPRTLAWRPAPSVGTNELRDVDMVTSADGWACGANGALLHYNGSAWSPFPISTTNTLVDVFMLSSSNGYMVAWVGTGGGSQIWHYDGNIWSIAYSTASSLSRIDGSAANNIWAVGLNFTVHYDGNAWTPVAIPVNRQLFGVAVPSSTEAWALGQFEPVSGHGLILHNVNNTGWTQVQSPASQTIFDTFFTAPNDGWAAGYNGSIESYILHYSGAGWTQVYTNNYLIDRIYMLSPIEGWGTSSVTGIIAHYDGNDWVPVTNPVLNDSYLDSVNMVSATDGWAVGYNYQAGVGRMLHYFDDGTPSPTATSQPSPTPTACSLQYTDVPPGSTFYSFIRCLACRGIISGYPCGGPGEPCDQNNSPYFRPNSNVTRGQIAKIVSNAAGFTEAPGSQIFEDVAPANAFYAYINRLYNRGVMGGYPCGGTNPETGEQEPCVQPLNRPYFRPANSATRGQFAKIDSNAAGYSDTPSGQTFEDVGTTHPFYVWIERLTSRGVMGGYPCGGVNPETGQAEPCGTQNRPYFRPYNHVTRGQTAKIVANTFFPNCTVLNPR